MDNELFRKMVNYTSGNPIMESPSRMKSGQAKKSKIAQIEWSIKFDKKKKPNTSKINGKRKR